MRASAAQAARWISVNQQDDSRYTYEYNRETATVSADYNIVRHAGVTASLYQAAQGAAAPDGGAAEAPGAEAPKQEEVVEADYEIVDDEKKKG